MNRSLPLFSACALILAACGGDDTGPTATPPTPASINVSAPVEPVVLTEVGATAALTARVVDSNGSTIPNATVSWASSSASVASVEATGVVTATSQGEAWVRGTYAGLRDSVQVVVDLPDAPTAKIVAPTGAAPFLEGASVAFRGATDDRDAEDRDALTVRWSSDLQGDLGSQLEFDRDDLVVGTHVITLIATDPAGLADTTSVELEVQAAPADTDVVTATLDIDPALGIDPEMLVAANPAGEFAVGTGGEYAVAVEDSDYLQPLVFGDDEGRIYLLGQFGAGVGATGSIRETAVTLVVEELRGMLDDADLLELRGTITGRSEVDALENQIETHFAAGGDLTSGYEAFRETASSIVESIVDFSDVGGGASSGALVSTGLSPDLHLAVEHVNGSALRITSSRLNSFAVSVYRRGELSTDWTSEAEIIDGAALVPRGGWEYDGSIEKIGRKPGTPLQILLPDESAQVGYTIVIRNGAQESNFGQSARAAAEASDTYALLHLLPIPYKCVLPLGPTLRRVLLERGVQNIGDLSTEELAAVLDGIADAWAVADSEVLKGCATAIAKSLAKKLLGGWIKAILTIAKNTNAATEANLTLYDRTTSTGGEVCMSPGSFDARSGECYRVDLLPSANNENPDEQTGVVGEVLPVPIQVRIAGALSQTPVSEGEFEFYLQDDLHNTWGGFGDGPDGPIFQTYRTEAPNGQGNSPALYWRPGVVGANQLRVRHEVDGFVHDELMVDATGLHAANAFEGDWYTAGPVTSTAVGYCYADVDTRLDGAFTIVYTNWSLSIRAKADDPSAAEWGHKRDFYFTGPCGDLNGTTDRPIGDLPDLVETDGVLSWSNGNGSNSYTFRVLDENNLEVVYVNSYGVMTFTIQRVTPP